jgi:lipopolysaccharide/colanic/teichoic acid biosynthesis glycosyltransferase
MTVIRFLDISVALAGGIVLMPVIIVIAILVRTTSPGPALFRQKRVGLREKPFICHKLRTMSQGTPWAGTHEISASAVTPLGRVLRRWKVDELPQLWNVLRGEMSLVGPRPCLPSQIELIEERRRQGVFAVSPGVTGPAQVKAIDMSTPARLAEEDATWALDPSLEKYIRLIILTIVGAGQGDRVREH